MSEGTQSTQSDAPGRIASQKPPIGDSPDAAAAFQGSASDGPTREYPESAHGDLDDVSVDSGVKGAVSTGPLTDGANQKVGREGEHDTGPDPGQ